MTRVAGGDVAAYARGNQGRSATVVHRTTRRRIAASVWMTGGIVLLARSAFFATDHADRRGIASTALWLLVGLALGAVKGLTVLSRAARRTLRYIDSRPEYDAPFRSFHPAFYALFPLMIGMGVGVMLLFRERNPGLVAAVYAGIGAALLASSRAFLAHRTD